MKIKLVQNDTGPPIYLAMVDPTTNAPIDLSANETFLYMNFVSYSLPMTDPSMVSLPLVKITGCVNPDGSINTAAPYNVPGAGGRCVLPSWPVGVLANPGDYQADIVLSIAGVVQTLYQQLIFTVRPT